MAVSRTSFIENIIEGLDRREMQAMARKFLTLDMLPMGDIQRWLEQRWRPSAEILEPGSITTEMLGVAVGRATVTGTGTTFADVTVDDGLGTENKYGFATQYWPSGTFVTDIIIPRVFSVTDDTTTFRVQPRSGNITNGQTVNINYWIWKG